MHKCSMYLAKDLFFFTLVIMVMMTAFDNLSTLYTKAGNSTFWESHMVTI